MSRTGNGNGILSALVEAGVAVLRALTSRSAEARRDNGVASSPAVRPGGSIAPSPGRGGGTETVELDPRAVTGLALEYRPDRDGEPDAGEIIWTWVPFVERDGRGKDRPVLVIAKHGTDRVYAVKLTSKSHDSERDYLSIGTGSWDSQGRESWVDVDQLYSVHRDGMRREAAALDRRRFDRVAAVLQRRFGWTTA
ncbi:MULTISPECIES: type II toxin-antitoxin system PemK/MazF family toxin [unclassified Microbacterium]|uniref:type II toxin-antitoxin system PemK/MazF family toxin n=1 Tax=unclassified Microbacterium TaxID=2609290 RepID=UPI00300F85FD